MTPAGHGLTGVSKLGRLRHLACRELPDGLGRQALTAHAPIAAAHLFDHTPGHRPHVLAFDGDHRVGQAPVGSTLMNGITVPFFSGVDDPLPREIVGHRLRGRR
jgi:hypothetical protein